MSELADVPSWLQALFTGIGGLGIGGYAVHRRLKSDRTNDTVDSKTQKLIETLQEQLDAERKNGASLYGVIDRLAGERNEAVQKVGQLEGTITALDREVGRLTNEIKALELKNAELAAHLKQINSTLATLNDRLQAALNHNQYLIAQSASAAAAPSS